MRICIYTHRHVYRQVSVQLCTQPFMLHVQSEGIKCVTALEQGEGVMCAFADLVSRRCTHTYTSICVSIGGGWWRFGARARRSPFSIVRLQLPLSGGKFRWRSGWGKRILFLGYNGAFSTFPPPPPFLFAGFGGFGGVFSPRCCLL